MTSYLLTIMVISLFFAVHAYVPSYHVNSNLVFPSFAILHSSSYSRMMNINRRMKLYNNNDNNDNNEIESNIEMITVRFTNTISGKDVITSVRAGQNLLFHADESGIELPRACRTGLCGSCTVDVKDPRAETSELSPREGYATIRSCSANCFVPPGESEMLVDVYRMSGRKIKPNKSKSSSGSGGYTVVEDDDDDEEEILAKVKDPMARFGNNWESDFKPNWELAAQGQATLSESQKSRFPMTSKAYDNTNNRICSNCSGKGRVQCYNCGGSGQTSTGQCPLCVGTSTVSCGTCNGKGFQSKRK